MSDGKEQKKTERLHMLISPAELNAIDDWRFKHRIGTRAEAIRQLVEKGLSAESEINNISTRLANAAYRIRQFNLTTPKRDITLAYVSEELKKAADVIEDAYEVLEKILGGKR